MNDDKIFFSVYWVAPTKYWLSDDENTYLSTEVIRDLLDCDISDDFGSITSCFILDNVVTKFGKQSVYVEYQYNAGETIIYVTDFEFFESDNISDAILDKLNHIRKLAE